MIPITFSTDTSSQPSLPGPLARISDSEVVLIEFQGEIHVDEDGEGKDGQLVGTLSIDESLTRPTLRIGHHRLEGKLVNLPKPLAVLQKYVSRPQRISSVQDQTNIDQEYIPDALPSQSATEWHGIAIIKRKIVFSKRPMPIVGSGKMA
ncbi:hypothetical protein L218DRAFT_291090 [Marasmius fiardii PR-910]|nr:hypothetical protein L218DRAFT_291090 [Marasmius fiardii PR-910]